MTAELPNTESLAPAFVRNSGTDKNGYSAVTDAQAHEQLRSAAERLGRLATTGIAETAAEFGLTRERERRQ